METSKYTLNRKFCERNFLSPQNILDTNSGKNKNLQQFENIMKHVDTCIVIRNLLEFKKKRNVGKTTLRTLEDMSRELLW